MDVSIHHPDIKSVETFDEGTDTEFHTVDLTDDSGGTAILFLDANWTDWDRLVTKVAAFRKSGVV